MIIENGVIIFLGLLLLMIKLPRKVVLRGFGYPLVCDLGVSIIAYALHWGTFSGVMSAAVAGLMSSAMISIGRWAVGYTYYLDRRIQYIPGALFQLEITPDELEPILPTTEDVKAYIASKFRRKKRRK